MLDEKARERSKHTRFYKDQLKRVMGQEESACAAQIEDGYTEEFLTKDVAVWMEPIDGTKAFADGNVDQVTNMIGITVNGRPLVGIIHKPFTSACRNASRTYVGSIESGLFYFDYSFSDSTTSSPTYVSPFDPDRTTKSGGHFQPQLC